MGAWLPVLVEQVVNDTLVVTLRCGERRFAGVLLDCSKKYGGTGGGDGDPSCRCAAGTKRRWRSRGRRVATCCRPRPAGVRGVGARPHLSPAAGKPRREGLAGPGRAGRVSAPCGVRVPRRARPPSEGATPPSPRDAPPA